MKLYSLVIAVIFFSITMFAQEKIVEQEFKVSGLCDMCKNRIEKSMKIKEVKFAKWNKKTQILKLAYDSTAIAPDSLMKIVANVGHDNELYKAEDEVYNNLPGCCLYREGKVH
ncbi:MAG: heavy-metal-associated domain-containing protein [Syntrophothermus sp.]